MHHHLTRNNFSEQIADELAGMWADLLEGARERVRFELERDAAALSAVSPSGTQGTREPTQGHADPGYYTSERTHPCRWGCGDTVHEHARNAGFGKCDRCGAMRFDLLPESTADEAAALSPHKGSTRPDSGEPATCQWHPDRMATYEGTDGGWCDECRELPAA
jgi:hypothetical protein